MVDIMKAWIKLGISMMQEKEKGCSARNMRGILRKDED
jgi:hypothetical protein